MHIELDVPPSVNHLYVHFVDKRGRPRMALSRAGKIWFRDMAWVVKDGVNRSHWKTADEKVVLDLWVWWPNAGTHDCDNLLKALQDLLRKNGVITDDSSFLPRWQDFDIDRKHPRVEVRAWKKKDGSLMTVGQSTRGTVPLCVACPPSCQIAPAVIPTTTL